MTSRPPDAGGGSARLGERGRGVGPCRAGGGALWSRGGGADTARLLTAGCGEVRRGEAAGGGGRRGRSGESRSPGPQGERWSGGVCGVCGGAAFPRRAVRRGSGGEGCGEARVKQPR